MAVVHAKVRVVDVPLPLGCIREVDFIVVVTVVRREPPPWRLCWPRRSRWALMNLFVLDVGIQLGLVRKGSTVNQGVWRAFSRACAKTGKSMAARIAMMAMTTRSSMSVKARFCI